MPPVRSDVSPTGDPASPTAGWERQLKPSIRASLLERSSSFLQNREGGGGGGRCEEDEGERKEGRRGNKRTMDTDKEQTMGRATRAGADGVI